MNPRIKKRLTVFVIVFVAVCVLAYFFMGSSDDGSFGDVNLSIEITHADGTVNAIEINTDQEFLYQAMEQNGLIEGVESDYGIWVTAVDGETADEANGQYWMFTQDGEWLMTSCDTTPIQDGESYEFYIYEWVG